MPDNIQERFESISAALGRVAALGTKAHLTVDLTNAKRDKLGRLEPANFTWLVSYPAAVGGSL